MRAQTYQKLLFAVLSLVYLLPFIQGCITTITAKAVMDGLSLNPRGMGLLGASYLFPYAGSMLFSGMLAAILGPRKTLAALFLVAGAGGVLFSRADSLALACLGRAMTGFGTAVCLTASFTLFSRWFRGEAYTGVTGLFFAFGGTGGFLGGAPLAIANEAAGWRWCYGGMGLVTLFFAFLVFVAVRDWPTPEEEKELGVFAAPRDPVTPKVMREGLGALSRDGDFWRLGLWFCALASIYQPFVNLWASPYFKDVFHLDETAAGLAVSMFSLGFIVGNPLLGWYCEKRLRSNREAIGAMGVGTAAGFLVLFLFPGAIGGTGVMLIGLWLGMTLNAANSVVYSSMRNVFGSRLGSVASGLVAGTSLATGAVMQLVVSGLLSLATGRNWAPPEAYFLAFCLFLPASAGMAYCGFSLTRASDPGHISTRSWRMILKKKDEGTPMRHPPEE